MQKKNTRKPFRRRTSQKDKILRCILLIIIIILIQIIILWLIPRRNEKTDETGTFFPTAKPILDSTSSPTTSPTISEKINKIVIIIDDAGNNLQTLKPYLSYPEKLTIAVLPQLTYSMESAELVIASGKELIMHQPMEAINGLYPGPGTIYTLQSKDAVWNILETNFNSVPYTIGINNHMGSNILQDQIILSFIMEYLKKKNKIFIDSRTINISIGEQIAGKYQVPFFSRDIFLDNTTDKTSISNQMQKGIDIAENKGYAIIIGHVQTDILLDVIDNFIPILKEKQIELSTLTEL